ncbi:MAG: NAD/NADP octopine/nopaline dehydrogenase family protein [Candidatus Hadarchaeum sp.]|uniref:NAD/NADP octopine/nopaline dehydrogenase family protein n=1 Tax=Candidatus Hadarchaeum sp. TaxID=2883567 RepID=UPI003D132D80
MGSGSGGFMCAADFSLRGHEVRFYSRTGERFKPVIEKGGIKLIGKMEELPGDFAKISLITTDIKEAISGADLIVNPLPFFGVRNYAKLVAPHIEDGQTLVYFGKGGGAIEYYQVFKEMGVKKEVYLGDTNTLPYGASYMGDNVVRLESRTWEIITTAFPGKNTDKVIQTLKKVYPMYSIRKAQSPLETVLVDYNAITHIPPMLCNAGRIESGDKSFHLFGKDSLTPSVVRLMEKVDRERMALSKALGIRPYTLEEEILHVRWNPHGENYVLPLYEAIHTPFLEMCEGPFKLETRHLLEDVPYGLVTYSSLGDMLNVPTPVVDAEITMAEALLDRDFRSTGRTVERMGIDPSWDLKTLNKYLQEGEI